MTTSMKFYFKVKGDELTLTNLKKEAITGNSNTYIAEFSLNEDWENLLRYAVFTKDENTFICILDEKNSCILPNEILASTGVASIGVYGTNLDSDLKRISTNTVNLEILNGTFTSEAIPALPTPSVWEQLTKYTIPKIGENDNWYLYNLATGEYEDTGVLAKPDSIIYYKKEDVEDAINNAILDSWEAEV